MAATAPVPTSSLALPTPSLTSQSVTTPTPSSSSPSSLHQSSSVWQSLLFRASRRKDVLPTSTLLILGDPGSGKSSLLHSLTSLTSPSTLPSPHHPPPSSPSYLLHYAFLNVSNRHSADKDEVLTHLHVWTLDEPTTAPQLIPLLLSPPPPPSTPTPPPFPRPLLFPLPLPPLHRLLLHRHPRVPRPLPPLHRQRAAAALVVRADVHPVHRLLPPDTVRALHSPSSHIPHRPILLQLLPHIPLPTPLLLVLLPPLRGRPHPHPPVPPFPPHRGPARPGGELRHRHAVGRHQSRLPHTVPLLLHPTTPLTSPYLSLTTDDRFDFLVHLLRHHALQCGGSVFLTSAHLPPASLDPLLTYLYHLLYRFPPPPAPSPLASEASYGVYVPAGYDSVDLIATSQSREGRWKVGMKSDEVWVRERGGRRGSGMGGVGAGGGGAEGGKGAVRAVDDAVFVKNVKYQLDTNPTAPLTLPPLPSPSPTSNSHTSSSSSTTAASPHATSSSSSTSSRHRPTSSTPLSLHLHPIVAHVQGEETEPQECKGVLQIAAGTAGRRSGGRGGGGWGGRWGRSGGGGGWGGSRW